MAPKNLQEILDQTDPVELLRNSQIGAYVYPVVAAEFTNWRREQRAWRETAVLYDQSHHMVNLFFKGPDALKLISDTAINSVETFPVDMAKQYVPTTPAGNVIGDGILFHLARERVRVRRPRPGGQLARVPRPDGRVRRRGREGRPLADAADGQAGHAEGLALPGAGPERVAGPREGQRRPARGRQVLPDGRDEHRRARRFARCATAWRARPASSSGGRTRPTTRPARRSSRRARSSASSRSGSRAYSSNTLESGWIPSPLPRSTPARSCARTASGSLPSSYEAVNALAGSFVSDDIEDYYLNPFELGYGPFVKFDHDFHGREALEKIEPETQRKKVTLAWSSDDVAEIFASVFAPEGEDYQVFDLPNANYGSSNFDSVLDADETVVGLSLFTGYSANEKRALSLATVDPEIEIGTELRVVWGEPDGGTRKTTVQPHRQKEVRVLVSPVPYSEVVRASYAEGWRTKEAVR